ncbi:MAG: hypothetical protein KGR98_06180 [Verrucomicrobia bacterium]|nr:hypothetical protein [Verrucomicrobiota bacterium]MDE3098116.1 hypothetical protein [Verrucomicrobiota bacterium]
MFSINACALRSKTVCPGTVTVRLPTKLGKSKSFDNYFFWGKKWLQQIDYQRLVILLILMLAVLVAAIPQFGPKKPRFLWRIFSQPRPPRGAEVGIAGPNFYGWNKDCCLAMNYGDLCLYRP